MALRDPDIRTPLREWIRANRAPGLLADEMPIREGKSRMDLALIVETLHGFEIKGDTDDMRRVPNQVTAFGAVCHRATMVTTHTHLSKVVEILPEWWEIIVVGRNDFDAVEFKIHRRGQDNPKLDFRWMTFMLHKKEMISILKRQGKTVSQNTPKSLLTLKIKEVFRADTDELWPVVHEALLERQTDSEWRHYHLKD